MLAQKLNTPDVYHNLSVGTLEDDKIKYERPIGKACLVTDSNRTYYELKLWSLPTQKYFLSRNNSNEYYTLFASSRFDQQKQQVTFYNPVGYATLRDNIKNHMQVYFNFPRQRIFMSLFPDNSNNSKGV